jgi:hypothetical protein
MAHVVYREATLLVDPDVALPEDVAERLRALDVSLHQDPATLGHLERAHEDLEKMRKSGESAAFEFYTENIKVCLNVFTLIMILGGLRDFEQNMRPGLEGRLRSLRMVQDWDEGQKVWAWVLKMDEDV